MIAQRAFQTPPAVENFASQKHPGDGQRVLLGAGNAVLLGAKQHIAANRPGHTRQKPAVLRQKAQANAALGACTHELRACAAIAKADDVLQVQQRYAAQTRIRILNNDRLPIQ